jgi:hypothetical protein
MPTFDFDVSTYEAPKRTSFEPLPPGDYNAIISDSQMKATKAGTGEYLELTIQIIDGAHSGRRIWERLNVFNANKVAEEIARSQLNGIKKACNVEKLEESEQLHDIPFILSLDIDRRDPTRNKVMGYTAVKGGTKASGTAPAAISGKKPWEKK